MAFTGTPTFTQISDRQVLVQGLSLGAGAAGVFGLFGSGAEIELPEAFKPTIYSYNGSVVFLSRSIEVTAQPGAVGVATAIPVSVVNTGGSTTPTNWRSTLTNTHATLATPNLDIMVKYHD
jgi:hypothetical protein